MTISLIASARAVGTSTTPTITHGLTLEAGDVLVAMGNHNYSTSSSWAATGTYQFTELCDVAGSPAPATSQFYMGHRVVTTPASETSYSWTIDESQNWTICLRQFRGVDTTNIWDLAVPTVTGTGADNWQYGNGTTATAATRSTNYDGSLAIFVVWTDAESVDFYSSVTNSFTDLYNAPQTGDGTGSVLASAIKQISSAGAIGATACTLASNDWQCALTALRAAPVIDASQVDANISIAWV